MCKISVVISYRAEIRRKLFRRKDSRLNLLLNTLKSLKKQTFNQNQYEIIVVDYGSDVPIKNYIKDFDSSIKVIFTNEKGDFNEYRAKNIGIRNAKGDYILCVNSDDIFQDNFLHVVYSTMVNNSNVIALCRRCNLPKAIVYKTKNLVDIFLRIIEEKGIQYASKTNVGDCQCLQRHIFEIIRGYDEEFEGWGWGDEDLLARVKMLGLKEIWLEDKTSIIHQGHSVNKKKKIKDAEKHQRQVIKKYKVHDLSIIRNKRGEWGKVKRETRIDANDIGY